MENCFNEIAYAACICLVTTFEKSGGVKKKSQ